MGLSYASEFDLDYDAPCTSESARPHPINFSSSSRVVADSGELGWRDAFASIVSRRAWSGRLSPLEHLGIGYCLRGTNRIERRLEGEPSARTVEFLPRQLALLPSHETAHFRVAGDADVLVVYLRGGMLRAVADRLFGISMRALKFQPAMAFTDPLLEQYCLTFAEALYRQRTDTARYIDLVAESMAAHCLVRYPLEDAAVAPGPPSEMETALQRVRAYVDDHLEGDLSLEALAEAASLSPTALKRAFALVHGETPKQWVIRRRVAYAKGLLAGADLPLAEIALRAGFASQSHFCALFKREIGRTPSHFRRAD